MEKKNKFFLALLITLIIIPFSSALVFQQDTILQPSANVNYIFKQDVNVTSVAIVNDTIVIDGDHTLFFAKNNGVLNITIYYWSPAPGSNLFGITTDVSENATFSFDVSGTTYYFYDGANYYASTFPVDGSEFLWSYTPLGGACVEDWEPYYEETFICQNDDTIATILLYNDTNECGTFFDVPGDNGTSTYVSCDYCTPDIITADGACEAGNVFVRNYTDLNDCYLFTGLLSDYVPQNTTETCFFEQKDFNCTVSDQPYSKDRIDYNCVMPVANVEYACINTVSYGTEDVQQVNPQKLTKTNTWLSSAITEEREYFTSKNGLLNAYYTNKNLALETPFLLTTTCSNGNDTLISQNVVTPVLKKPDNVNPVIAYAGNNSGYIIILVIGGILFIFIFAWIIKKVKGR